MKVLHLIDSIDYSGSAQQLHLLGPALGQEGLAVEICTLGPSGPWVDDLRGEGVTVHALGWCRWFDPSVLWNLHKILRQSAPDLIHVWRLTALRALAVVARDLLPRVVMSAPLAPGGQLAWWDRWLLERVRLLGVAGVGEQQRCRQEGLATPAHVVAPAACPDCSATQVGLAKPPQTILGIGSLERQEGFHLAVWAFDILRQMYPEAELHLVGTGSQEPTLKAMAQGLQSTQQVHFLGRQTDLSTFWQTAAVVWVPSVANCGRQVALDAMAHGCAVIASDLPHLRDVIVHDETGYLVPPGEVVPLARRTHALFQDAQLRARLGQAARRHVAQRFSVADVARRWCELYRSA